MMSDKFEDMYVQQRQEMLATHLKKRGICDAAVLKAMANVPRHMFVLSNYKHLAYADCALPIEYNQTISQPYIVALMTELCQLDKKKRVLEIGTGCGYQTAVLAEICAEVYSIEISSELHQKAKQSLASLGYHDIHYHLGDGQEGWPQENLPFIFDAILITAAMKEFPTKLCQQLKVGGHCVVPLGEVRQELFCITRTKDGFSKQFILPVRFVRMQSFGK